MGPPSTGRTLSLRCAVVGNGRVGRALVAALPELHGPFGRGFDGTTAAPSNGPAHFDAVLLAVPDAQITAAAAAIQPGPLVGHCAGALGMDVLGTHEAFGVHPLMTVPGDTRPGESPFCGAGAAVAGSTPRAAAFAHELASALGMRPVTIADADRAAYHAAASIAANLVVTLEDMAERLVRTAGGDRELLAPLVRAAVENWVALGPGALTGPIARGDHDTVARQRAAVEARLPDALATFDVLGAATELLARRSSDPG